MALTLPNTITAGTRIDAAPLQTNFQAIQDKFNGNIADPDILANAGIHGSKIATNSLDGSKIASNTVTLLQMGTGSVGTAQLVDLNVTKGKLSQSAGSTVTKAQTSISTYSSSVSLAVPLGGAYNVNGCSWLSVLTGATFYTASITMMSQQYTPINATPTIYPFARTDQVTTIPVANVTILGSQITGWAAGVVSFSISYILNT